MLKGAEGQKAAEQLVRSGCYLYSLSHFLSLSGSIGDKSHHQPCTLILSALHNAAVHPSLSSSSLSCIRISNVRREARKPKSLACLCGHAAASQTQQGPPGSGFAQGAGSVRQPPPSPKAPHSPQSSCLDSCIFVSISVSASIQQLPYPLATYFSAPCSHCHDAPSQICCRDPAMFAAWNYHARTCVHALQVGSSKTQQSCTQSSCHTNGCEHVAGMCRKHTPPSSSTQTGGCACGAHSCLPFCAVTFPATLQNMFSFSNSSLSLLSSLLYYLLASSPVRSGA